MRSERASVGAVGERLAAEYLRRHGYRVVERNARLPQGEIDIVAREGKTLVIVEVRTRRAADMGTPEESVDARKRQKLRTLAEAYLQVRKLGDVPVRIDVVAVELGHDDKATRITLIKSAVER